MTIINTTPDRPIQLGYEGEDRVTVLRFRYGADWLENGEGIFRIRVRRHGEKQAYNAALVADDAENNCLLMTVTNVELSVKGSGEMQVVYSGADFVKKSPIYSYNVSRAVDEVADPPAQDVYTQLIESLSELGEDIGDIQTDIRLIEGNIGNLADLTTEAKTDLVSAINEVNEHGGSSVTVDSALSDTSENPVQNKTITRSIREVSSYARDLSGVIDGLGEDVEGLETALRTKADTQTVSALSDAVNDLDSDVQGLQTAMQSKADVTTVTALSGTVSGLQTAVQSKADTSTVTALSGTVSDLSDTAQQYIEYTSTAITNLRDNKANKSYVDDKLATKANAQTVTALSGTVTGLQTSKADKSYVDTQLAGKASTQTVSDLSDDVSDLQTGIAGKIEIPHTDEAKVAIQKMLGIYEAPWELINEETFTNETEADYVITTDANGDAFELSDVILMFETPKQSVEAKKQGYGQFWMHYGDGSLDYFAPACTSWVQSANSEARGTIAFVRQDGGIASFFCTAGATSTNSMSLLYRWRTSFDETAQSVQYTGNPVYIKKINIRAVTGTGHYVLYGKRKWQ